MLCIPAKVAGAAERVVGGRERKGEEQRGGGGRGVAASDPLCKKNSRVITV